MDASEVKTVEVTERVPVTDRKTLKAWLNQEMAEWASKTTKPETVLGHKAIDLIQEAGFTLTPPTVKR